MRNRFHSKLLEGAACTLAAATAILLVVCCASVASAQPAQPTPTPIDLGEVKDFRLLFEERETLIDDIKKLETVIEDLNEQLRDVPPRAQLEGDLNRLKGLLAKEQKAVPKPDDAQLATLQRSIDETTEKLETAQNAPQLQIKKDERDAKRRRLTLVEQKIASLFDDKRDVSYFRAISTVIVGLLIAVVVGGFYLIAWKKDGIAARIFGGEMGMQFVTLFLIVIAIILFGIMGTLEGRELAALLGGLSGYILGKASLKNEGPATPEPAAAGPAGGES